MSNAFGQIDLAIVLAHIMNNQQRPPLPLPLIGHDRLAAEIDALNITVAQRRYAVPQANQLSEVPVQGAAVLRLLR